MLSSPSSKLCLAGWTVALAAVTACSSPPPGQPNVLLVLIDALRYDHLGFYGYPEPTSPYLDEIAGQSVVFDEAYAHAPQTITSTASLFTSRFFPPILFIDPEAAGRADLVGEVVESGRNLKVLAPLEPTFPELLASAGYRTAAFLTNPHHHADSGFPALFAEPHYFLGTHEGDKPYQDGTSLGEAYLEWLAGVDDRRQPFLAYVHFMDVHNPYRPPEPFASRFVTAQGTDRYVNGVPPEGRRPDEADLAYMRQSYDAEIAYVDSVIRRIHEATLKHATRATVMIVTSDHGDEFMEHGGLGHGRTLEPEQLRVPLLIHGSGRAPGRYPHMAAHVDVGPSVLALAGVGPPPQSDGRNLLAFPARDAPPVRHYSVAYGFHGLISLTTPEWHFIKDSRDGAVTLYDKVRDPEGRRNLALERPDEVRRFELRLEPIEKLRRESIRQATKMARHVIAEQILSVPRDEVLDQLRSLGYLE